MPTDYTTSLRLALPASGELSGTWGAEVNTAVTLMLEQAITGYLSVTMADANVTLTTADGAPDEARNAVLRCTGTLTADRNLICPTAEKLYLVLNNTTGGFNVTIKTALGTGVLVPSGASALVFCDGTNVVAGLVGSATFPTIDGTPLTGAEIAAALAAANKQDYMVSCSDLTTSLIATTSAGYFRALYDASIVTVRASLLTASTSGAVEIDLRVNGTSVLSTPLSIDVNETTSLTAAVPVVVATPGLIEDDVITVDITSPGSNAKGLVVSLLCIGS